MLLNQCLAISVSPSDAYHHRLDSTGDQNKNQDNINNNNSVKRLDSLQEALFGQIDQSSAELIFRRLIKQNQWNAPHRKSLEEALNRVEFAGFVLPSWLLISGTYQDLQCIRSSWIQGELESPICFKIETIGNIRYVNVDYFTGCSSSPASASASVSALGSPSSPGQTATSSSSSTSSLSTDSTEKIQSQPIEQNNSTSSSPYQLATSSFPVETDQAALEQQQQQQQQHQQHQEATSLSSRQQYKHHRITNAPALLEALLFETIRELREENSSSTSRESSSKGVRLSAILGSLKLKLAKTAIDRRELENNSSSVGELVDWTIGQLVESGRLLVSQAEIVSDNRRDQESLIGCLSSSWSSTSSSNHSRRHKSSARDFDQLISSSPPTQQHQHQHQLQRQKQTEDDQQQPIKSGLRQLLPDASRNSGLVRRRESTTPSATSKSTTLDSGIQASWDLISNNENSDEHEELNSLANSHRDQQPAQKVAGANAKPNGATAADMLQHDHLHRQVQLPQQPTTTATTLSANYSGQQHQQQQQQHQSRPTSRLDQQRRGFSLSRSLSFRPSSLSAANVKTAAAAPAANLNSSLANRTSVTGTSKSADRWTARSTLASPRDVAALEQAKEKNFQKPRNLSSLFRSKSLRIISSRSQKASVAELLHQADHLDQRKGGSSTLGSSPNQPRATIDYLANNETSYHKRSFSMRRNSLLNFNSNSSKHSETSGGDNFLSNNSGRLVLFLRKLFSGKRRSERSLSATRDQQHQQQEQHHHHHHHHQIVSEARIIREHFVGLPAIAVPNGEANQVKDKYSMQNKSILPASNNNSYSGNKELIRKSRLMSSSASSPSSNSTSGSSSLIEILDCSSAVNSSRRPLREENLIKISNNSARATTIRLMKRSESSLSHNSNKSSASSTTTNNSTVSQQLRKHLDDAYKRHRNCTNQREKEFIDSINVLRQASRHALQSSAGSSSAGGGSSGRKSKSSASSSSTGSSSVARSSRASRRTSRNNVDILSCDDTTSSVVSSYCCSCSDHHHRNKESPVPLSPTASTSCRCKNKTQAKSAVFEGSNIDRIEHKLNQTNKTQNQECDLMTNNNNNNNNNNDNCQDRIHLAVPSMENILQIIPPPQLEELDQERTTTKMVDYQTKMPPNCEQLDHWLQQTAYTNSLEPVIEANHHTSPIMPLHQQQHPHDSLNSGCSVGNCCICTSYLNSMARLCPITRSGISPASLHYPTGAGPCCPAGPLSQPHPSARMIPGQDPTTEAMSEYCCPLWRSMVYNYHPIATNPASFNPFHGHQEAPTSQQQAIPMFHHQTAPSNQDLTLTSAAASQQQQHHQHNTTIDLKIEIGPADLGGKKSRKLQHLKNRRIQLSTTSGADQSRQPFSGSSQVSSSSASSSEEDKFRHGRQANRLEDSLESSDLTDESLNVKIIQHQFVELDEVEQQQQQQQRQQNQEPQSDRWKAGETSTTTNSLTSGSQSDSSASNKFHNDHHHPHPHINNRGHPEQHHSELSPSSSEDQEPDSYVGEDIDEMCDQENADRWHRSSLLIR